MKDPEPLSHKGFRLSPNLCIHSGDSPPHPGFISTRLYG
jgi:hypothetical protein